MTEGGSQNLGRRALKMYICGIGAGVRFTRNGRLQRKRAFWRIPAMGQPSNRRTNWISSGLTFCSPVDSGFCGLVSFYLVIGSRLALVVPRVWRLRSVCYMVRRIAVVSRVRWFRFEFLLGRPISRGGPVEIRRRSTDARSRDSFV